MRFFIPLIISLMLAAPAGAVQSSHPAQSGTVNVEQGVLHQLGYSSISKDSAAALLARVVRKYFGKVSTDHGRSVETVCKPPYRQSFSCQWWIIKGPKERGGRRLLGRDGDGTLHRVIRNVYTSGGAQVTDRGRRGIEIAIG